MDLLLAAAVFLCASFFCMAMDWSLAVGLVVGIVCFALVGHHRGYSWKELAQMLQAGVHTALVPLKILFLIGCLTGLWRSSGTIAFFMYEGMKLIVPQLFLVMAFLLSTLLGLSFGSAFGVGGTVGVILVVIARTGEVNLAMTAGAVLSGAYLGERVSSASASAALTAAIAKVDQNQLQRQLWKTTLLPVALCLVLYGGLSVLYPLQRVEPSMLAALEETFHLSWWTVLPAAVMLVLPLFHVSAVRSSLVSCVLSAGLAHLLQGESWLALAHDCVAGCRIENPELSVILSGGGIISMMNGMAIILLSCASSGILRGAKLLEPMKERLEELVERTDLFFTTILVSLSSSALLCNQSIAIIITEQMLGDSYAKRGYDRIAVGQALGDTAQILPAMIPWSIAASVPLSAMEVSSLAILFSFFVYLCPLCDWFFHSRRKKQETVK